TLKAPLESIASAVQTASGDQSGQVQTLLQDVLVAFMNKLDTSFGQQFTGLHDLIGQSASAMQSMQQGFGALINDMRVAGESSTQTSATLINQLLEETKRSQDDMRHSMSEMLANLQATIAMIGAHGEDAGARMATQLENLFAES